MDISNRDEVLISLHEVAITSAFRPEEVVVGGVNWEVRRDDFWVIGGLHGSGKTDLLLTAAGLQKPGHGNVTIFGQDQAHVDERKLLEERKRIGVVFENGGRMFRNLTVIENIALPLRYHENLSEKNAFDRILPIVEMTGLAPFAHNTIGALSVPWQQRVGFARALALRPEILLIDKPTLGPRYVGWWLDFLQKLHSGALLNQAITIVLTTEDFRDWSAMGTRFAMIKGKRWQILGGKAELARSQDELWRDAMSEIAI